MPAVFGLSAVRQGPRFGTIRTAVCFDCTLAFQCSLLCRLNGSQFIEAIRPPIHYSNSFLKVQSRVVYRTDLVLITMGKLELNRATIE